MKKIKIILMVFATLFVVNGCEEEDFELTNPSGLSPETYFRTEAQVQSAVNAVYANTQTIGLYTRTLFFAMDIMSREALGIHNWKQIKEFIRNGLLMRATLQSRGIGMPALEESTKQIL